MKQVYNSIPYILVVFSFMACHEDRPQPYTQQGKASYYALMLEGYKTASGVLYRQDSMTAAHKTLPLGTWVRVVNLQNNKEVIVEINDRGPFVKGRIIDLSRAAARQLEMMEAGIIPVMLEVVKPAPGYTISDSLAYIVNP